jgi:hypothetical protein
METKDTHRLTAMPCNLIPMKAIVFPSTHAPGLKTGISETFASMGLFSESDECNSSLIVSPTELKGAGWGPRTTPNVEGGSTAILSVDVKSI